MPRPAATAHPLRALRQILGVSQRALAHMVGLSSHTVLSVENGRLAMSERFARRIEALTGAKAHGLLDRSGGGKLLNQRGKRYTRADYEEWLSRVASPLHGSPDQLAANVHAQLTGLFRDAEAQGTLALVYHRIIEAVAEGQVRVRQ